jgi:RNA polymerase sigma factor (sigma-70 family)
MFDRPAQDSLVARASAEPHDPTGVDPARLRALSSIRPRIRAYLRRVIRDRTERWRALSDVYSEVLALDLDRDLERTAIWRAVLPVLRRIARDEWRWSREISGEHAIGQLAANGDTDEARSYRLALWAWEDDAMRHLSPLQRGALELHVMDGRSDGEIAELLGCSRGSVRILRATAKKRLRTLMLRGVIPEPPRRDALSVSRER